MPGEKMVYKRMRVTGSKASLSKLPQEPKHDFCSHSDGQHGGSDLPEENGGYKKSKNNKNSKKN